MRSRFDLPFTFPDEFNMIIYEDVDLTKTTDIKVKVPCILTSDTDPVISNLRTAIFINSDKPSITSNTIREQNYMTATINNNSIVKDLKNISNNDDYSYILKKGDIVRGRFLNNKFNKLSYTITGITKGDE